MVAVLSLLYWLFVALTSIVLFVLACVLWLLTVPFDRRRVVLHRFTCFWASLYTWIQPNWHVAISGREKIRSGAVYVMVANHQSLLDIFVLFRLFTHFKWVSKIEMFRLPLIGWNMALNGYIALRRGDKDSIAKMMNACERTLARGSSVLLFPEGTRTRDGNLGRFKHGAFTLAQKARVPLLPIVVDGTYTALPASGFVLRGRHDIRVEVLDEIPYAEFEGLAVEEVAETVRSRYVRALAAEG
jgi:1-acyl-sn-glycerol-3-phosphate acyltransferase